MPKTQITGFGKLSAVRPVFFNDIELYVSHLGCGMSQSGLGRFVGTSESTIRELLSNLQQGKGYDSLSHLYGKELFVNITTTNNANVVKSSVCAAICQYFAYDSKLPLDAAKFSLEKFATMGIDNWIKSNAKSKNDNLNINELLAQTLRLQQQLLDEQKTTIRLQNEVMERNKYVSNAIADSPGLERLLESSQNKPLLLAEADDSDENWLTLRDWLNRKGLTISDKMYRQLRLKVSQVFETMKDRQARRVYRQTERGNSIKPATYHLSELHFIESVFFQVMKNFEEERISS